GSDMSVMTTYGDAHERNFIYTGSVPLKRSAADLVLHLSALIRSSADSLRHERLGALSRSAPCVVRSAGCAAATDRRTALRLGRVVLENRTQMTRDGLRSLSPLSESAHLDVVAPPVHVASGRLRRISYGPSPLLGGTTRALVCHHDLVRIVASAAHSVVLPWPSDMIISSVWLGGGAGAACAAPRCARGSRARRTVEMVKRVLVPPRSAIPRTGAAWWSRRSRSHLRPEIHRRPYSAVGRDHLARDRACGIRREENDDVRDLL